MQKFQLPAEMVASMHKIGVDFVSGCVVKYVVRHSSQENIEDLRKAQHYLGVLIKAAEERLKGDTPDNQAVS
jgi:hypothetical protein